MSTTNNQTRYEISYSVSQSGAGQSDGAFTIWAEGGANDAAALAIYQALVDAPWNSGCTVQVNAFKTVDNQTTYEPNLTTTPPSFV